ncbi:MAG: histone deacetylase [bacterium]|nr:histone deacetylase [bacterium]
MDPIGLAIASAPSKHPAPPGHQESHERLAAAISALQEPEYQALITPLNTSEYNCGLLSQVHSEAYIDRLANYPGEDQRHDEETFQTSSSFDASCDMTWSLLSAVEAAFGEGPARSFVLGRPPGHHAGREQAMGFCLVNHVAVAAQYALDRFGVDRVAIVDFDVHHGNGTQDLFYDRANVLYLSSHQHPLYPGTGLRTERGADGGEGFTVNYPLAVGTADSEFISLFENEVAPSLRQFHPDIVLVSAGFDGHALDPLGGLDLTGVGFNSVGRILRETAEDVCKGRVVSIMEGGYNPEANRESICNYIKGIAGQ